VCKQSNDMMTRKLNDSMELLGEKDRVIQILRDELAAHQLELVQKEEQFSESSVKRKELEAENRILLERWISLKEKEASQMNEANAFVESALRTKESMATRVFSLFSSGQPVSRQSSSPVVEAVLLEPSILPSKVSKIFKKVHDDDINCMSISADGSLLATGGNDKNVVLYGTATGTPKAVLTGSVMSVMSVCFSPTSEFVLASSNDHSIKIWDCTTRRLKHTLTGHLSKIFSARYTDMNTIVSGSHDRTIKVWDLTRGVCSKTIFTLSSCNDLASLSSDGSMIISGHLDNNLRIWDTKSGQMIREITGIHFGQITSVQASPGTDL
jgi:autophagy-related protein 16-1